MADTPRAPRGQPDRADSAADLDPTGLQSIGVGSDNFDGLAALVQSVAVPSSPGGRPPIIQSPPTMALRRTLIPLLLTSGVVLNALALLWNFTDPDSPFRRISPAVPISLAVLGAVLLLLAVANMLLVKHNLQHRGPASGV